MIGVLFREDSISMMTVAEDPQLLEPVWTVYLTDDAHETCMMEMPNHVTDKKTDEVSGVQGVSWCIYLATGEGASATSVEVRAVWRVNTRSRA
jgi:hypothetical protein